MNSLTNSGSATYLGYDDMNRSSQFVAKVLKKMEDRATVEGSYIVRRDRGKVRLLGYAIGILIVGLVVVWMAHHS